MQILFEKKSRHIISILIAFKKKITIRSSIFHLLKLTSNKCHDHPFDNSNL